MALRAVKIVAVSICCLLLNWPAVKGQGTRVTVQPNGDVTLAEGVAYVRICTVIETDQDEDTIGLEWIRNEEVIVSSTGEEQLQLEIGSVTSSDAGEYFCQAVDNQGTVVSNNASGGILTVLDSSLVVAPSDQYVVLGGSIEIQCSTAVKNVFAVQLYSPDGSYISNELSDASLDDAGRYECSIQVLVDGNLITIAKEFSLHVVVPTAVTSKPAHYTRINANMRYQVTVGFSGRMEQWMTVTWTKDSLPIPSEKVETQFLNATMGQSVLTFDPILRADSGVYRVVVRSTLGDGVLAAALLTGEVHFQLDIVVKPTPPDNVEVDVVTATGARVMWSTAAQTQDQAADSQVVKVFVLPEIEVVQEHPLTGDQRELRLEDLLPGITYQVSVVVVNPDGEATTNSSTFKTDSRPPEIIQNSVAAIRTNLVTFALSLTLLYTGGGGITEFKVEYRDAGSSWRLVETPLPSSVPAASTDLAWTGVAVTVADEYASRGPLDFQITVRNAEGLLSQSQVAETLVPPGPPLPPVSRRTSHNSLVIAVPLSNEGTPPITQVTLEVSGNLLPLRSFVQEGLFLPGSEVVFAVNNLSSETPYMLRAYSVNFAGQSAMSSEASVETSDLSSEDSEGFSMILIVVIVVCATGIVIAMVIAVVICMCLCFRHRHKKHGYPITRKEEHPVGRRLSDSHEMVERSETHKMRATLRQDSTTAKPNEYIMPPGPGKTTSPITGQQLTPPSSAEGSPENIPKQSGHLTELDVNAAILQSNSLMAIESAPTLLNQLPRGSVPTASVVAMEGGYHYVHHGRQGSLPVAVGGQMPHHPRHISRSHAILGNGYPSPASRGHIGGSAVVLPSRRRSSRHERVPSNSTCSSASDYPGQMSSTAAFITDRSSSAMAGETSIHPAVMSLPNPIYIGQQPYPTHRRLSAMTADSESEIPVPSDTSLQCVPSGHSFSSSSTAAIDNHLQKLAPPHKFKMPTGSSCSSASSQELIHLKLPSSHPYMISALPSHSGESIPNLAPGVYSVHSTQESVPHHPSFTHHSQLVSDV